MARTIKIPKQPKVKEPVRVRYKALSDGSQSVYLDIYRDGKRQYEFLKLYLIPETSAAAVFLVGKQPIIENRVSRSLFLILRLYIFLICNINPFLPFSLSAHIGMYNRFPFFR